MVNVDGMFAYQMPGDVTLGSADFEMEKETPEPISATPLPPLSKSIKKLIVGIFTSNLTSLIN